MSSAAPPKRCYLDITADGKPEGRIVIEVYPDKMPISSENFMTLCKGNLHTKASDLTMHYKGSRFHSVRPDEKLLIGGDWKFGNGCGGFSIYPGGKFKNEPRGLELNKPGAVGFVAEGQECSSIFFIDAAVPGTCDYQGYHVFGYVVEGLSLVERLSQYGDQHYKPTKEIVIAECGVLQ